MGDSRVGQRRDLTTGKQPSGTSESDRYVVDVGSLRVGMRLAANIHDAKGRLLLAAGTRITTAFLQLLQNRHIRWVTTQSQEALARDAADHAITRKLDSQLKMEPMVDLAVGPVGVRRRQRLPMDQLREQAALGIERHSAAADSVESLCGSMRGNKKVRDVQIYNLIRDFTDMVALDLDLLPTILSLQRTPDEYLFHHCVNVAMMSITIASYLGLRYDRLMGIGIGALLQDVGMLDVPETIRLAPRALVPEEFAEVKRHPVHTLGYMAKIPTLPIEVQIVGYQVHERFDKSGYPRNLSGQSIHPYARIVAIADAYTAMTCPRPYRPPLTPFAAAKRILIDCSARKFDSTYVRAFLDCISLFPIGSYVELDNGHRARVIRANPGRHTEPLVEISDDAWASATVVDLAKQTHVKIVRPLESCPS